MNYDILQSIRDSKRKTITNHIIDKQVFNPHVIYSNCYATKRYRCAAQAKQIEQTFDQRESCSLTKLW